MSGDAKGYWYLACPYSSPHYMVRRARFDAANQVAANLIAEGRMVYSPISMGHPIAEAGAGHTWEDWKALDLAILESPRCEGVIVLTIVGWDRSAGVEAEIAAAKALGKPVLYLDPLEWRVREEEAA